MIMDQKKKKAASKLLNMILERQINVTGGCNI
jgi:hypothetical protein